MRSFDIILFSLAAIAVLWALRFSRTVAAAIGARPFRSSSVLHRRLISTSSSRMSTSINVAGFSSCGDFQRARTAAQGLGAICPDKFTANIKEFADREEYNAWLAGAREVDTQLRILLPLHFCLSYVIIQLLCSGSVHPLTRRVPSCGSTTARTSATTAAWWPGAAGCSARGSMRTSPTLLMGTIPR